MTSIDHTQALDETLGGYFARLCSVACVTIVQGRTLLLIASML
jgi:hypothetical protein